MKLAHWNNKDRTDNKNTWNFYNNPDTWCDSDYL